VILSLRLNQLHLSPKGKGMDMVKSSEELNFFLGKLLLCSRRCQGGSRANLLFLDETVVEGSACLQGTV